MDESTFETFEDELVATQHGVPPQKHPRQARRPEMYPQRRGREDPLAVKQIPKSLPHEVPVSRVSLPKSSSIQNVAQIETPWEGVTLNRCLFLAITILILTSGWQRLHESLRGRRYVTDVEPIGSVHTIVKKYRLPVPEPETSLWDTFLWWLSDDDDDDDDDDDYDDDDDDDEEVNKRGKSRKETREKTTQGLRHKAIPDRRRLKGREGRFKAQRDKSRQNKEESRECIKTERGKVKRHREEAGRRLKIQ